MTKDLFIDVVAYTIGEPGATGSNGWIECLKATGETFEVCYLDKKTNWELIKENFEAINGCKFNGPYQKVHYSDDLIAIGEDDNIITTIKDGWREICFDCGNHFVCKEEYARGFIDFFNGVESWKIVGDGMQKIRDEHFTDKLDSIASEYFEQEGKDKELARELRKLNKNPE